MPYEHIRITPSAGSHAQELNNAVSNLENARETLVRLKTQVEAMIHGSNYARVEELLGVPSGTGQTTYNLIAGTVNQLTTNADLVQIIRRLG